MRFALVIHIIGGGLGLLSGYTALFASKGSALHRRSGDLFVAAMLMMSLSGTAIAAVESNEASTIGGIVTAYLVITAFTTVRPRTRRVQWIDLCAMTVGLAAGLTSVVLGLRLLATGGQLDGIPAPPFFILGLPALSGAISDAMRLRNAPLQGVQRLRRHLWRMCYALFIAAISFFLGQAEVIPPPLRSPLLRAIPVFVVIFATIYWLRRTRVRRALDAPRQTRDRHLYATAPAHVERSTHLHSMTRGEES